MAKGFGSTLKEIRNKLDKHELWPLSTKRKADKKDLWL
jgi:hypothetical protein